MTDTAPAHAQAVVIGGGILGISVAYHLAKRGWRDVVLVERAELTAGTTWHAAGLMMQVQSSRTVTLWGTYNDELIPEVEALTRMGTGYRRTGSILMASTEARWEEIGRSIAMAHAADVEVHAIGADEAKRAWPLMDATGIVGAAWYPNDAVANATDLAQALAAAARLGGVRILQHTTVTGVEQANGRVTRVRTSGGDIATDTVVNCTGMWARDLGRPSGVSVPLHAAEHFYLVTEPIEGLAPDLPVLRCPDERTYVREDTGKLLIGFLEPVAKPWATMGIPEGSEFIRLPEDWDHLAPEIELAARRLPLLRDVGIMLFFNGPESFTPDDRAILGPAPELAGYWVAAGFNSHGLRSGAGAGRALADWIVDGDPQEDLWAMDIRRFAPFQRNRRYLHERVRESVGLLYAPHWPFRQVETARGIRKTPFYDRLAARGACFGELMGWERANWFAPTGVKPAYEYAHGRQNWFPWSAEEHRAVRDGVALFDESTFGKILVSGPDACAVLNRICTADVDVPVGRIVYTQWLNDQGRTVADVTVTRLDDTSFLVATGGPVLQHDLHWIRTHIPDDARAGAVDVSNAHAVLGVMGPRSRELLASLTDCDLSNEAFPFGTSREIDLGYAFVRASRITYVGELGWELWIPADVALHVYDTIVSAGDAFGLRHAGFHAMDSLRIEKAYRSWGHDMGETDSSLEAGLGFTHDYRKPGGFLGRDAALRQRGEGLRRRLAIFALEDPEPLLAHDEPIWRDGVLCGWITSAAYGHTVGRSIGMGYVANPGGGIVTPDWIESGHYELEIAHARVPARVSLRALYDPSNERIRA
jgi:glycine cleavage system aminomethyltransferase T/glycine/D-amino acid oxidase-like deaminating enzyme